MGKISIIVFFVISLIAFSAKSLYSQHLYDTVFIKKHYDRALWSVVNNSMRCQYQLAPYGIDYPQKGYLDFTQQNWLEYGVSYAKNNERWYLGLFKIPEDDTTGKGDNEFYNGSYSFADKKYNFDLNVSWGKGFFDDNTNNFQQHYDTTSKYIAQPDMTLLSVKMSYWTFTNYNKFSYNAAYQYVQQQKKSAGSLFYMGELSYLYVKNKNGLIPDYAGSYFNDLNQIIVQNTPTVFLGGGITGTFVIKKCFFINGLFLIKAGLNYSFFGTENNFFNKNYFQPVFGSNFYSSVGINTKKFVIAYNTRISADFSWNTNFTNTNILMLGSLYLGYRFNKRN